MADQDPTPTAPQTADDSKLKPESAPVPAPTGDATLDMIAQQGSTEGTEDKSADPTSAAAPIPEATATADPKEAADASIEELLKQANFEDASAVATENPAGDAEPYTLPSFQQVMADAQVSSIDLLRDVELNVKIELGRSRMLVEDVLKLVEGSVVELDQLAGDPVDVFVNDRLVARGEVLVLNDNFCVRVNEIVAAIKEEA